MKKVTTRFSVFALMLLMSLFTVNKSIAQAQSYECKIQNINLVSSTVMEFDVYLKNTGTATLLLNAFQAGIDFNYIGMAGGGTITGAFVAGSNTLPAPQSVPNWNINATSKQIRLLAAVVTASSVAAPITATPLKLGTFRMTNTLPFASCSTPNFSWSFITAGNKTKTGITAWVNGAISPSSITDPAHSAATFANGGGPQHYVQSNPSITCCPSAATFVGTNPVCFGDLGSAVVTITGAAGSTGGSYTVDGGSSVSFSANPFTISGLSTGGHTVLITPSSCTSFTLNLSIGGPTSPLSNTTTASACDSYTWGVNGTTYTQSGTYSNSNVNGNGCTVTEILNLTINNSTSSSASVSACDSYTWTCNGQNYSQSGTYICSGTNAAGCPNTETLNLTVNYSTTNSTNVTACDSYTWAVNGTTYTSSGTYISTSTNAAGCSHTETLNLTINNSTNISVSVSACDSYTWTCNGMTYSQSGVYTCSGTGANGCPTTTTLNLTINTSTSTHVSVTACDSYTWSVNGMTYTASGSYSSASTNAAGCSHTDALNLTINNSTANTSSATACDSYTWAVNGMTYNTSGTYTSTSTNASGCPHTETLNLVINSSTSAVVAVTVCGSYTWACNGLTYSQSGTYICAGTNSNGCPDITTLNLTITNNLSTVQNETACGSYTWGCNGQTYTQSGSYSCNTTGTNGCPSVVTLNLTINASSSSTTNVTACDSYTWAVNGNTYTSSGTYTATSTNAAGCLHTETLNLTINNSTTTTTTAAACGSYTWASNGFTYTVSGTYFNGTINAANCPNVDMLILTINGATSSTSSATACDSYTWPANGMNYTASGTYTATSTNALGCPHTETLNLTINNSTSGTTTATACDSYIWSGPEGNGNTYTSSNSTATNVTTNAAGCPHTQSLNLTINNSTSGTTTAIACDSYTWSGPLGDANTYTSSNSTATNVTTNAAGCTHTETLNLTINSSTTSTETAAACNTYTWACNGQTYTQSGTHTCTSTNAAGCPNTATLNLTINSNTSSTVSSTACTSYLWPCNGQTYTQSGSYTCTGTNANGCAHVTTLNLTINNCNVPQTLPYECIIKNINQVSPNVMEFDVFLTNLGTTALKLNVFQGGIDFNYTGMAGTGTITGAFVAGSNSLPAPQNNPNWNINTTTKQIRLLASVVTSSGAAASITATPLKLGTFRMTNTVPFTPCVTPNFTWSFVTAVNKTKSTITAWIGTGTSPVSITDPAHAAASFANGGGPQHYVQSNAMTICCPATATYVGTDPICYGGLGSAVVTVVGPGATASTLGTYSVDGVMTQSFVANPFTVTGLSTGSHTVVITPLGCAPYSVIIVIGGLTTALTNTTATSACGSYTWAVNGNTYTQSGTYSGTSINSNGCTVNETLNLTINTATTSTDNVTSCDTYTWACNGQTYTSSGTYTCAGINAAGCAHTTVLNLTINNSTSSTEIASACDSYTWACNGQTYTASGIYACTGTNSAGCLHTTTLNLTINNSSSSTMSASACNSYTWLCNGQTYTQSGTYTCMSTNTAGCSHTTTLNLTINSNSSSTASATACDSYSWSCNNQTYTQSGNYTCLTTNAAGCPHVSVLNLTVNYSTSGTAVASACDSYTWGCNGQTYTQSGTYTCVGMNNAGCPHTTTLNLTVNSSTSSTFSATACNSYTWSCTGQTYTQSGTYTCIGTNAAGCAHTTTLVLTINNSTSSSFYAAACDSYTWSCTGQTYTQSGAYTCTGVNSLGCPHTTTLNLTINNSTSSSTSATACNSYNWSCNNQTYTQSGSYTCVTTNAAGCPLINVLNLTINNSTSSTVTASACDSYTWGCNGQTYTTSGTYTCTGTNTTTGCPHLTTLILTINQSTASTVNVTACDSYNWSCNGQTYYQTGVYTCTGSNSAGCPHTNTLNLVINSNTTTTSSVSACNSYTWGCNGQTYNTSGSYTCVTTNTAGCTQVNILVLTINTSTTATFTAAACNSLTWSCNNQAYTQSGTYTCAGTNSAGCPQTNILNLTINNTTTSTITVAACNSLTWSCNGQTYTQTGSYTCLSSNTAGCTHVNILNLTINSTTTSTLNVTACNSYLWSCNSQTYTQSGIYTCVTTNAAGCVHVSTLNLTINNSTSSSSTATACGSYTWGCNGQTYTTSGTYTCVGTNTAGCPHTTTLTLIINAIPVVTAGAVINCPGSSVALIGSPAGGTFSLPNPYIGSTMGYATSYTYTVTNQGCSATATGTISYTANPNVSNLTASNITSSTALITWAGSGVFEFRYRKTTSTTWLLGATNSSLARALTGLSPSSTYTVEVRASCNGASSNIFGWVGSSFVTPSCAIPVSTTTTNITMTSAKLNWTHPGALNFNIRYKKSTVTAWTTITGNVPLTKTLTGLLANTQYQFQVQANCPPVGAWSATGTFTTLASKMGESQMEETIATKFNIYPNPTKGMITADVTMEQATQLQIEVIDMTGRKVKRYDVEALEGVNQYDLDLFNLTNGIYSIRFFTNGEMIHQTRITKSE